MACKSCNLISTTLRNREPDSIKFDIGSIHEIRDRGRACVSCRQFNHVYDKADIGKQPDDGLQITVLKHGNGLFMDLYRKGKRDYEWVKDLGVVGNQPGDSLMINSPMIDLPRLRKWLDVCDKSHHSRCHHLPTWQAVDALKELLFIDVEQGRLVQCPGTTRYFALSYLWGYIPDILETKVSNVDDLKQSGAFTTSTTYGRRIPQTIRDSISLVRALGERYLWVDRFCIVQDHPAKHAIISRMDAVYANAYCTIVAADGTDANHGLRGVGCAREILQQPVDLPQCSLVTETDVGYESKYHTRGWTYQELNLSARQLIFAEETVFWACQASFWKEQMCGEPADVGAHDSFKLPSLRWPDLSEWELFCCNYNWRELSFQEDAHVAFSGVERVIERSFPGAFLYGLPEFFFDLTLLWWPNEPVARRVKPSADNGYCLPSWSWLGWHGRTNGTLCNPLQSYVRATDTRLIMEEDLRIEPLAQWIQVGPRVGQERKVRNDYHVWRAYGETQCSIPTEWTCQTTEQSTYYTNASVPDVLFRHPLPSAPQMPPEEEQRTWPPYLQLRTHCASFIMKPCKFENVPETMVLLADNTSRWAGVLLLNINSRDAPFDETCELVALSRGSARQVRGDGRPKGVLAELYWDEITKNDGAYDFYNVLWIKREGDYVVREGVGRVEKSVWERQSLEPIDTQLR